MRLRVLILFIALLFFSDTARAQELFSIHSAWDDDFSEWNFYTVDEQEGILTKKWINDNNWTEWVYEFDGLRGQLNQKWNNNNNEWELRTGGTVVTIKTKWRNDFSEWRLSDGTISLTLLSKYTNVFDVWLVKESKFGKFEIVAQHANDPRDWDIYDELEDKISLEMKMAMIFIAIIQSLILS